MKNRYEKVGEGRRAREGVWVKCNTSWAVCLCVSVKFPHILSFLSSAVSKGCVSSLHVHPSRPLSPCFNLPVLSFCPFLSLLFSRWWAFLVFEPFICLDCESVSKSGYKEVRIWLLLKADKVADNWYFLWILNIFTSDQFPAQKFPKS